MTDFGIVIIVVFIVVFAGLAVVLFRKKSQVPAEPAAPIETAEQRRQRETSERQADQERQWGKLVDFVYYTQRQLAPGFAIQGVIREGGKTYYQYIHGNRVMGTVGRDDASGRFFVTAVGTHGASVDGANGATQMGFILLRDAGIIQ